MRNVLFAFLISFSFLISVAEGAPSQKEEVQLFLSDLVEAMNTRNLNGVIDAWSDKGEMITLAGGIYKGKAELRQLFQESFSNPYTNAKYELLVQFVRETHSDAVAVDGIWKTKNAGPPGYPQCGIFLYNLSKRTGRWKINMAYSSVPRQGHTAEHGREISWVKACQENETK